MVIIKELLNGDRIKFHAQKAPFLMKPILFISILALALLPDCTNNVKDDADPGTKTIGVEGGEISFEGAVLKIPANALSSSVEIKVSKLTTTGPDGYDSYSSVFKFEPSGLSFANPVTVRIPFSGTDPYATIFWSKPDDSGYTALSSVVANGVAETQVTHFSEGFVANPLAGHWDFGIISSCSSPGIYVELRERLIFQSDGQVLHLKEEQDWSKDTVNCCAPATGTFAVVDAAQYTFDGTKITSAMFHDSLTTWQPDSITIIYNGLKWPIKRVKPFVYHLVYQKCPY